MIATRIISLSVKQCYESLYEKVLELKPDTISWSSFIFNIVKEWYETKQNGITNFFQPPASWNRDIKSMNDEEYKRFYTQLDMLNQLERANTGKRLTKK